MTIHIPVLMDEVLDALAPQGNEIIVDGTLGGCGHTLEILKRLGPDGRLICMDRDGKAVDAATEKLRGDSRVTLIHSNYADLPEYLEQLEIKSVDGILLDLGLSSDQLADRDRGFSYQADGELDLRFDQLEGEPAWRLVNRLSEKHLANLIYEFGEERLSRRIARKICEVRRAEPIKTANQLADLVRRCVPRSKNHSIDPATRTFQALRIAVNEELKWLSVSMKRFSSVLNPGGRFVVISFHSLEDRIVKHAFADDVTMQVITKKPVMASEAEIDVNARSRSAKLRVAHRKAE